MRSDLTTIEILGLAIRSEEDAAQFYSALAKRLQNALVRMKFEELAREEGRHRQVLTALYKKTAPDGGAPHVPGAPDTAESGDAEKVKTESLSIEAALGLAIKREGEAQAFYQDAASKTTDISAKRLLEYLSDIEQGHKLMLEAERAAFKRDENWYADHPDIQLV